jgi:hypothetical protein
MYIAVFAWAASFVIYATCTALFLRKGWLAGMVVCLLGGILTYVRPLLYFFGLDEPFPAEWFGPEIWDLVADALMLSGLWVATLTLTCCIVMPYMPTKGLFPQAPAQPDMQRVVAGAILATLFGFAGTAFLAIQAGGLAQFIFAVKISKDLAGFYVVREISTVSVIICYYALFLTMTDDFSKPLSAKLRQRTVWLLVALIALNFAVNFAWGNRYNIALEMLIGMAGWHFVVRKITFSGLAIIGSSALVFLHALRTVRNTAVGAVTGREISDRSDLWTDLSTSLHLVEFDALMLAMRDAGDKFDFRWGQELVSGLLAWIPRAIWPDKQVFHIGGWFRRLYQPEIVNGWPVTTQGGWYLQFGWTGVLMGGIASGFVIALVSAAYRDYRINPWHAAAGFGISFLMIGTGFGFGVFQQVILLLVPIWIFTVYLKVAKHRRIVLTT